MAYGTTAMTSVWSGDCLVVASPDGRCWSGEGWVSLWSTARQFRRPDRAYELCEQEAREAERRSGTAGVVCYIPLGTPPTMPLAAFTNYSQIDLRELQPQAPEPTLQTA